MLFLCLAYRQPVCATSTLPVPATPCVNMVTRSSICGSYMSSSWAIHMYYLYVLVCVVLPVRYLCHLYSCYLCVTCGWCVWVSYMCTVDMITTYTLHLGQCNPTCYLYECCPWFGCSVTQHLPHSAVRSGEMKIGENLWESPGPWAFPHMCKRVKRKAVYFSSLIPKMLMFTLAITCLTTYNLPWFMDLTFQVPMQYCSLQHLTLFSPPDTSKTGYCFYFGSASLFLWICFSSLLQYHNVQMTWGVHHSVSYLFAFSYYSWCSQGKSAEVVCHSLIQWATFCQNSPPWLIHLGWPYMAWLVVSDPCDQFG